MEVALDKAKDEAEKNDTEGKHIKVPADADGPSGGKIPSPLLAAFQAVTRSTTETAKKFLESAGENLEAAVGLFFDSDASKVSGSSGSEACHGPDRVSSAVD